MAISLGVYPIFRHIHFATASSGLHFILLGFEQCRPGPEWVRWYFCSAAKEPHICHKTCGTRDFAPITSMERSSLASNFGNLTACSSDSLSNLRSAGHGLFLKIERLVVSKVLAWSRLSCNQDAVLWRCISCCSGKSSVVSCQQNTSVQQTRKMS